MLIDGASTIRGDLCPFDCPRFSCRAQALDSASYYEVIDGNIPANINLILRYHKNRPAGWFLFLLAKKLRPSLRVDNFSADKKVKKLVEPT